MAPHLVAAWSRVRRAVQNTPQTFSLRRNSHHFGLGHETNAFDTNHHHVQFGAFHQYLEEEVAAHLGDQPPDEAHEPAVFATEVL